MCCVYLLPPLAKLHNFKICIFLLSCVIHRGGGSKCCLCLTVHISVLGHGVDLLVGQDLHVLAARPTVQLVDADQPAAYVVRHSALLAYMLREIRRGLIGYLSEIRWHCNRVTSFIDVFSVGLSLLLKLILN